MEAENGRGRRIGQVVILGGGTAGWMTATALARTLGRSVAITLLESEEIGTVGVGEATIPTIHWFNDLIGLDEAAFVAATQASFKLGIEFVDWARPGHRYFHPFGQYGVAFPGVPFHHRWLKAQRDGLDLPLDAFSLASQLAKDNRFAKPVSEARSILSTLGYAYHFDAGLYARHLRGLAEAMGVRRVEGKLGAIAQDPQNGFITAITTQAGERLDGDLFIDCSGFRALLIEGVMQAGFEDWSHWLPCDRAVAVPCARVADTTPYTRSTARSAGWQWRIPLQHRTGNGYVYASAFLSDDEAAATLLAGLDGEALADPRFLRFTAGRRRRAWVKNVVAIGLSSGFLEPLESTSIHLIQSGIAKLLTLFPDADCDPGLADRFNLLLDRDMDNIKDFLILHYHATADKPEPLWQHCRAMVLPDTLVAREAHYRATGRIMIETDELFREASWLAVLNGQGILARDYSPIADTLEAPANRTQLEQIAALIARAVPTLPRHDAAIAALTGGGRAAA
ncbi:tryptophan halogenase family protein [Sphingobium algorifonticola]|uniref:Tryptophan 7-halogenase n=1 Tax=Sphingobium algorifonticola TaxID=2008318 RepID=A0A437JCC2_9SPHN|nr:tryptophan halogenase family protein [Sphingobium algorifonticola]RVT43578.1 tryptophan 7-halogenase [Sphingobium algorifonticola]